MSKEVSNFEEKMVILLQGIDKTQMLNMGKNFTWRESDG